VSPVMSDSPAVLTERRDGVLVITLNRPDVRNAINEAMTDGLADAMDELDGTEGLQVGILTGAGGFFCAGMDLGAFVGGENMWHPERGFGGITQKAARKPLIAAVEGFAVAGGLELALSCDLIVAAQGAKMGLPEAKRALVAAAGGLVRLPRRIPYHVAMELALTGDLMPAERFEHFGLVNRVVEKGTAFDVALELAQTVAANGPLAVAASKQVLQEQADWSTEEMWERQDAITAGIFTSEDAQEGSLAFKERRPPVYTGR
jgi:enoyl-CoA hydratase/carnithine racemase